MKKLLVLTIALALAFGSLSSVRGAESLNGNVQTGGTTPSGKGGLTEFWSTAWYGMRITVVDVSDASRVINGVQLGKIADGTRSVDISNLSKSDAFFTRKTAGDGKTALVNGAAVTHFGKVSKLVYRDGATLTAQSDSYDVITVQGLPVLLGKHRANSDAIEAFINNDDMLTNIAEWCGGGLTFDKLMTGSYKILTEPIMYCLLGTKKYAFTANELALLKPHGEGKSTLLNNTLANAFFLEYAELGWRAWDGPTNVNQPFEIITAYLGMHIYSINEPKPDGSQSVTPTGGSGNGQGSGNGNGQGDGSGNGQGSGSGGGQGDGYGGGSGGNGSVSGKSKSDVKPASPSPSPSQKLMELLGVADGSMTREQAAKAIAVALNIPKASVPKKII